MGWEGYGQGRASAASQGFVQEGNVFLFVFPDKPTKVRFLTEDVDIEQVMKEQNLVREAAQEYVATRLCFEKWVMPIAKWEHQIKEIPGKRYFSTAVCLGRNTCPMCAENERDRQNGVTENKMLSYPVRKRFLVPVYVYDLNRVLILRAAEDFINDVAKYIGRQGINSDFEVWKEGKGFNTKYKSAFLGVGERLDIDPSAIPAPGSLDFSLTPEELARRIDGGGSRPSTPRSEPPAATQQPPAAQPAPQAATGRETVDVEARVVPAAGGPGDFVIPFGSHKGRTVKQVFDLGETEYLTFLAKNASGAAKDAACTFLASQGVSY